MKVAGTTGDTSEQAFAARKDSGLMPDVNRALDELRADGTLKQISDKYFGTDVSGTVAVDARDTWELIWRNLWPMLVATVTQTIPLTAISFVLGLVIALLVALARISKIVSAVGAGPCLRLRHPRHAAAGAAVHRVLRAAAVRHRDRPVPGGGDRVQPERRRVRRRGRSGRRSCRIPKGQWEAAQTIGMGYATTLQRVILPQAARTAVPPLSNTLISLVKDTSLASTILVTELLRVAQLAAAPTFDFFALYGVAAVYYWVICSSCRSRRAG